MRVRVVISGRVQGVFFRAQTQDKARSLALTGWVKNTDSGTVEAVFDGEEEKINQMIDWCHQGPALSKVDSLKVTKLANKKNINNFSSFEIKH